jgi:hypothetical protein
MTNYLFNYFLLFNRRMGLFFGFVLRLHCRRAPALGFCVWAFAGACAAVRCSAQCFFYFFLFFFIFFRSRQNCFFYFFCSRQNCFFYFFVVVKTVFLFFAVVLHVKTAACHPLSIFAQIYYFLSIFTRNLYKYRSKSFFNLPRRFNLPPQYFCQFYHFLSIITRNLGK